LPTQRFRCAAARSLCPPMKPSSATRAKPPMCSITLVSSVSIRLIKNNKNQNNMTLPSDYSLQPLRRTPRNDCRIPCHRTWPAIHRCTFPVGFMRSCGHICVLVCLCGCVSCRGQHLFPCPPLKRSCDSRVFVAARHESWQFGFKSPSFPFSIPISPACCTYLCSGIANTHACTPKKKWLGLEIGASRPFNPFNS